MDYLLLFCNLLDNDPSSKYLATQSLAYWYNHHHHRLLRHQGSSTIKTYKIKHTFNNQQMFVRWQNTGSESFRIFNGVRQGGLLSPCLFRLYIRNLTDRITKLNIGCHYFGTNINLLAYADDIVLLHHHSSSLKLIRRLLQGLSSAVQYDVKTKKRAWCGMQSY